MITTSGNEHPIVSVAITAFNLEKLLPRAIDSVLAQETDMPTEILIGDDCSQDRTPQIAKDYQTHYPNLIRVFRQPENVGVQRNTFDTWQKCRGKYIAWLDGDDCWTDPMKLSLQVQAMEADPSISICCHFVRWVSSDGVVKRERVPSIAPGRYKLDDIIRQNFVQSPSVMFKNGAQRQLPDWYFRINALSDWPLHIVSALSGDIMLLDRVMADYTLHSTSSFMSKGPLFWEQTNARFYEFVEALVPRQRRRLVRKQKGKHYETIAYLLRKQGDFTGSRRAAIRALTAPSLIDNVDTKIKTIVASLVREMESKLHRR